MLYFAPINFYGNFCYRHLLLKYGADFVFSELIRADRVEESMRDGKFRAIEEDIHRTIFQIGAGSAEQIDLGISAICSAVNGIKEINLNMGCPQSTMQQRGMCGGILHDLSLMRRLAGHFASRADGIGITPSVKLRLGTDENNIMIEDYLELLSDCGINKIYIHARPLRYGYIKPIIVEHIEGIRERFPELCLVMNGDIDSLQSFESIGNGDAMIGRAALSNPSIFNDIKNGITYREGNYDPILKDPNLIRKQDIGMSQKKKDIILEFLAICIEHRLPANQTLGNLSYLLKGMSGAERLIKKLRTKESNAEIRDAFSDALNNSIFQTVKENDNIKK